MANEKNLIPYKKGQSGNPLGNALDRHSTKTFRKRLLEMLDRDIDYKTLDGKKTKMKVDEGLLTALMAKALFKQDVQAARILIELNDGKPAQTLRGDEDQPLVIDNRLTQKDLEVLKNAGIKTD